MISGTVNSASRFQTLARLGATLGLLLLLATPLPTQAQEAPAAFVTTAKQAFMIEAETGTVLYSLNENQPVPPASITKLMTAEYVFHLLQQGKLTVDTEYPVSENAWRTGGALSRTSTMFAALNSKIRVADLLRGVTVQVANDACIILAEGISGSEADFAKALNDRAAELGLKSAHFVNSNGLPDPANALSVHDMVTLARQIQTTYPDFYRLYAEPEFEWNKITQRNKNPLLALQIGADGLVAGFAEGAGYAIVGSVNRDGKRLILAIAGLTSEKERVAEARRIFEWGLASFDKRQLFGKGEVIASASVFGGAESTVPLYSKEPVEIFVAKANPDRISARIAYQWPLKAPVQKDQQVGILRISSGEHLLREVPLYTSAEVTSGTLTSRALDGIKELLFFWL